MLPIRAKKKKKKKTLFPIGNLGKVGGGGVIRDCHGDWVKGYSKSIGYTTSVLAEWWALQDRLILAIHKPARGGT